MEQIRLSFKDRSLIHKLYVNERTVIRGENEVYEETEIWKRVRQGSSNLSPTLFNLYIEKALKDLRDQNMGGIKVNGILVQPLRFADDIAMIADS